MDNQIWNYLITAVGLIGFFLAGKKVWWCWYVNIFNQVLWFTYGFVTEQWGFVVGTFFYTFVFCKNAYSWTKEHFEDKKHQEWRAKNPSAALSIGFKLDAESFGRDVRLTQAALVDLGEQLEHGPKKWRWLPRWLRKRIFGTPVKWGQPGPKVGQVTGVEERDNGLYVTGTIDRSTMAGQKAWDAIAGPVQSVSLPEVDRCTNKDCGHAITNRAEVRPGGCAYCKGI